MARAETVAWSFAKWCAVCMPGGAEAHTVGAASKAQWLIPGAKCRERRSLGPCRAGRSLSKKGASSSFCHERVVLRARLEHSQSRLIQRHRLIRSRRGHSRHRRCFGRHRFRRRRRCRRTCLLRRPPSLLFRLSPCVEAHKPFPLPLLHRPRTAATRFAPCSCCPGRSVRARISMPTFSMTRRDGLWLFARAFCVRAGISMRLPQTKSLLLTVSSHLHAATHRRDSYRLVV